jgi:transcriptional regulator with XRE-family HTH domain
MADASIFGSRLKEGRIKSGLKQRELAAKVGVCSQAISGFELNSRGFSNPSYVLVVRIARIFGITPEELFGPVEDGG